MLNAVANLSFISPFHHISYFQPVLVRNLGLSHSLFIEVDLVTQGKQHSGQKVSCVRICHLVVSDPVTPWTIAYQDPLSMGFSQARMLECVAIPSSRGSSRPRNQTWFSRFAGRFFTV